MPNALFAFDDLVLARQAREALIARGVPPEAVQWHGHARGADETTLREADELATGGLVTNLLGLFQGLFEWSGSPHDASVYAETVRRGGAVLAIDGQSEAERAKVEEVMATHPATQRTGWSDGPTHSAAPPRAQGHGSAL